MGMPVVTVASGGMPVVEAAFGTPVTEAANKYGMPVTKVVGKPGLPVVFETIGVVAPFTAATLDTATTYETTLTNGNRTATRTAYSGSLYGGARCVVYKSAGKYYFETTIGAPQTTSSLSLGVIKTTGTYQNFLSDTTNCAAVSGGGQVFANDIIAASGLFTTNAGDVFSCAVDFDNRKFWARENGGNWNGNASYNPATNVGGFTFGAGSFAPAVGLGVGSLNHNMTINLGATAFAYAVPAGFTAGWPAAVEASYTGPGDVVSGWAMWWGLRAFSAAVAASGTTNIIKLRRDSDNATQDFVALTNGSLDVASIATFKGAANLFVHTLYDQTGNGVHAVQTGGGDQPPFTLASLGSLPTMGAASGAHAMNTTGTVTQAQPFTVSSVVHYDGTAGRKVFFSDIGLSVYSGRNGANAVMSGGSEVGSAVSNGWHSAIDTFNAASSEKMVDGVGTAVNANVLGFSAATVIFYYSWAELLTEVGMRAGTLSGANKTALDAQQRAYWGI